MAGDRVLPSATARQLARSQALFREVNERITEIARGFGLVDAFSILCECVSSDCQERIRMTSAEYQRLRRSPTKFAVLHDQQIPAVQRVVEENDRFATVQTLGEGDVTAIVRGSRRARS